MIGSNIDIDKIKILEKIGHGMMGTIYLASYKNKKYAYKIEHVLEEDVINKNNLKYEIWREIDFCKKVANKYPEYFIELLSYDIIDMCEHKQKYSYDLSIFPQWLKDKFLALAESSYCSRKVYSLVDDSLANIFSKLSLQEKYSYICQLSNMIWIMHEKGFVHYDLHRHLANMGVCYTNKKYLKIKIDGENFSIPTFGKQYKALDYGLVLHESYKMTPYQSAEFKYLKKNELKECILRAFISKEKYNKYWKSDDNTFYTHYCDKLNLDPIFMSLPAKNLKDKFVLYQILHPVEYQRLIHGKNAKVIPYELKLPIEDLLYCYSPTVDFSPSKIISYFSLKLSISIL